MVAAILANVLSGSFGKALGTVNRNYELAGLRFDSATGVLTGASGACKLEPKAADVLALLFKEQGALVPRQRLLDECWDEGAGSDEALTQAIAQIRRALEALNAPRDLLTTHPKRGYRLAAANQSGRQPQPQRLVVSTRWIALAVVAALLVATIAIRPHWPRHLIRHALGLGPKYGQLH